MIIYNLKRFGLYINDVCAHFFYVGLLIGTWKDNMPRNGWLIFLVPLAYIASSDVLGMMPIHIIFVLTIAMGMIGCWEHIKGGEISKIIVKIGRHSLAILIFHPIITTLSRLLFRPILSIESTGILLSVIILFADVGLSILIENLMRRARINKLIF